jgi:8'-apo-carotenoid 13,14-cleaving dioxygenase
MAPPIDPSLPRSNDVEAASETTITGLKVRGTLPARLSGRLKAIGPGFQHSGVRSLGTGDGVLHSVHFDAGRAVSYRNHWVATDAVARNIIAVGGSILALGDRSLAYELTSDLGTVRRVDLAGQSRGVGAFPRRDPVTGDLHMLAIADTGIQAHVVVSASAFTRTSRPIAGAPNPIKDLAITGDHVVFVADGFIGVTPRGGEANPRWVSTGIDAPYLVHAHDAGDAVIVYVVTPSLERWTLHAPSATVHREVLDPTPQRFARTSDQPVAGSPRFLWAADDRTAVKHDLFTATHDRHLFAPHRTPGDLVFVADTSRTSDADGGWLVGFVHHTMGDETDVVVLDAADISARAIATVTVPRRVPHVHHSTWIPSTHATDAWQDST